MMVAAAAPIVVMMAATAAAVLSPTTHAALVEVLSEMARQGECADESGGVGRRRWCWWHNGRRQGVWQRRRAWHWWW